MEKADNSESDEISKAADLVNICNINIFNSGDDDNLIIKQSQAEINLMYNQSDKIITQDDETTFQTGIILSSGKLDIKILVLQRRKHESYSSQRMERIQVTQRFQTELNFNPNKVNNIIALNQNNGARSRILRVKRWQSRNRLETLERILHAPGNKFLQFIKFITKYIFIKFNLFFSLAKNLRCKHYSRRSCQKWWLCICSSRVKNLSRPVLGNISSIIKLLFLC